MKRGGWVYIMTNRPRGVLYIGVTSNIAARIHQHKIGEGSVFCKRNNLDKLVLTEEYPTTGEAVAREKAMKSWKRDWKIELIEKANPDWDDYRRACSELRENPALAGMTDG